VRPRDFQQWAERPPEEQVAHQVSDIRTCIQESFSRLDSSTALRTSYEAVISSPVRVLSELSEFLGVGIVDRATLEHLHLTPSGARVESHLEKRIVNALGSCK